MSSTDQTTEASYEHPIYDDLLLERGDAVKAAHAAAEEVEREAGEALDWTSLHKAA